MEPTNHPFRKENDLNQTSMIMFHVNLPGCTTYCWKICWKIHPSLTKQLQALKALEAASLKPLSDGALQMAVAVVTGRAEVG